MQSVLLQKQSVRGRALCFKSHSCAAGRVLPVMHAAASQTGYLYDELFLWHNAGTVQSIRNFIEPTNHWEHPETKRRLHSLLAVSSVLDHLKPLKPRRATDDELSRVHCSKYVANVKAMSDDYSKAGHICGDVATFAPGGYEVAVLAAGGAIVATDAVLKGEVQNAYALVRPPGHHAERAEGAGFCIFNNVAVAAAHALDVHGLKRIAIVDYDVHHGNGTQHIFEKDPRVLFISVHQDSNYPLHSGYAHETGRGEGEGYTINVPLPPGSGSGAYQAAFERVVLPSLEAYQPELVLVSSGYDAAFMDPLAAMILSSQDFRWMAEQLLAAAQRLCGGKIVFMHEGGYSEKYVPFCGLAVVEAMSGVKTSVQDPWLNDVTNWAYQALQPHQDAAIAQSEKALALLKQKVAAQQQQQQRAAL